MGDEIKVMPQQQEKPRNSSTFYLWLSMCLTTTPFQQLILLAAILSVKDDMAKES